MSRLTFTHIHVEMRVDTAGRYDEGLLLDARVGRKIGRLFELVIDGTNLLDVSYEEVPGVAMPGAAVLVSLGIWTT